MKILIISTVTFDKNGVTNVIRNNYEFMDKKYKVDFVFPNNPDDVFLKTATLKKSKVFLLNNRLRKPIQYLFSLLKIMKDNEYDIVHIHGNSHTMVIELFAAYLRQVKVRIPHGHSTSTNFPLIHNILSQPFNRLLTEGFACGIKAGEWLYRNNKFTIIYNGINIEKYKFEDNIRNEIRTSLGFTPKDKVIGHIGRFHEVKNQIFLIKLLPELRLFNTDFKLLLIGDGEQREKCEKLAISLNVDKYINFYGSSDNVNELLMGMDMFMMPSKYEGVPLTLIEAQASELPCLISDSISQEVQVSSDVVFFNLDEKTDGIINKILTIFNELKKRDLHKNNIILQESEFNIENGVKLLEARYEYLSKEV